MRIAYLLAICAGLVIVAGIGRAHASGNANAKIETQVETDERGVPVKLTTTVKEKLRRTVKVTELGAVSRKPVRVAETITEIDPRSLDALPLKIVVNEQWLDEATQKPSRTASTVRVFEPRGHQEISVTKSINDFDLGTGLPKSRKQTQKQLDLRTGKTRQLTAIDTKIDQSTQMLVHTIIVADFEPSTQRLLAKTTKVEYEDFHGRLPTPEGAPADAGQPAQPIADTAPAPERAPADGAASARAYFSSPFQPSGGGR